MNRREFALRSAAGSALLSKAQAQTKHTNVAGEEILPGIWRFSFGTAEDKTPVLTRRHTPAENALSNLTRVTECPIHPSQIIGHASVRGYQVELPLAPDEMVYGFGLQFHSFLQRGLKKTLRVNADPKLDTGDSHAPVPFYVTSQGYGVFVDTLRYATFYCGNKDRKGTPQRTTRSEQKAATGALPAEYARYHPDEQSQMIIEAPCARGLDVYIIGGPTMHLAVQRYNLFAGGGALPPRWGLGFWYRCDLDFNQQQVLALAQEFRDRHIPCDVLGLEPGWQTHSYSCSYVWSDKFLSPREMLASLSENNFQLNLWEHAFVHPTSPIHNSLLPFSGDYEVWDGLVPDFLGSRAKEIFSAFHDREHVALGVSGYKLDECDNSDFTGNWSFPELSRFPTGVDGEQMHSCFGLRYQDTIADIFERRGNRTFSLVRSSGALASPYPFVLYSDLYDHTQFIRALVNSGFSGLLWCPEVRDAHNAEDLLRRMQTAVFSTLSMVNAWYIKNPPWKEVNADKNNAGQFAPDWEKLEASCRDLIGIRMQLVPYLYSAFARYHLEGTPPVRALVMDYRDDPRTWTIDDQYFLGESLLVAPVIAGQRERKVYLPDGDWFDFWSGAGAQGRQSITVTPALEQIPVFVRDGALLPLAEVTPHTADPRSFNLTVRVYGNGRKGAVLYEDDGKPNAPMTRVLVRWNDQQQSGLLMREGRGLGQKYQVRSWQRMAQSPHHQS